MNTLTPIAEQPSARAIPLGDLPAAEILTSPASWVIQRGAASAVFIYDVGFSIDLDRAQTLITDSKHRESFKRTRRAPKYFEFESPPLRIEQAAAPQTLGRFATQPMVEVRIYDFGAMAVEFDVPLSGPFVDLLDLSEALYDNLPLLEASRAVVDALSRSIAPAISKLEISDRVEDYVVFQIEHLHPAAASHELVARAPELLAQILRAERGPLARQEIDDALACHIAFSPEDMVLIDWNSAILFDREPDDVRAVLEFANVELLEMRLLDHRLDQALDRATKILAHSRGLTAAALGTPGADLHHITEMQMDAALLYEAVNNSLKLLGDPYLARVSRLAAQRLHLNDWDASILRKLQTLESVYQKMSDRNATRRLELLEWIIIILIAVSIVLPFVSAKS